MSIISDICAERDREVVQEAIRIARAAAKAKYTDKSILKAVDEALVVVLHHCDRNIQE